MAIINTIPVLWPTITTYDLVKQVHKESRESDLMG